MTRTRSSRRTPRAGTCALLLILSAAARPLAAQDPAPAVGVGLRTEGGAGEEPVPSRLAGARPDAWAPAAPAPRNRGLARPILGGIAGGVAGAGVGFVAGLAVAANCEGDEVCLVPALVGAMVGETLILPLGVHLAEDRRGSYPLAALATVAVTAAGMGVLLARSDSDSSTQGVTLMIPVAQLWAAIATERRTAR